LIIGAWHITEKNKCLHQSNRRTKRKKTILYDAFDINSK
jgi:hypothetical protein